MKFTRLIIFTAFLSFLLPLLYGCYDDPFLEAMKEEEDFIAPYDVVLSDNLTYRTAYFNISDTEYPASIYPGDDAGFTATPNARSFTESLNVNSTTGDIVDDNVTGLTWTKCSSNGLKSMKSDDSCSETSAEMSWNDAFTTCDTLSYAGYDDWRLPALPELFSLVYFGGTTFADLVNFPDTAVAPVLPDFHSPAYWTSTSRLYFMPDTYIVTDYGWVVFFNGYFFNMILTTYVEKLKYDSSAGTITASKGFVRCVRGGLN